MPLFDLKKQLIAYGAYHRDPTNVRIHIACVPVLLATALIFGTASPTYLRTPALLQRLNLPLNASTLFALTYASLYPLLSPNPAGLTLSPLILAGASVANRLKHSVQTTKLMTVAGTLHVVCWIAQFVGHGKFEGRKPALLDNVAQALFLAPLFVWYEVLFWVGGYSGLRAEVEKGVGEELERMQREKGKGKAE